MILTGKAVEFAEELEESIHENGDERIEMDEKDQMDLFFCTRMFEINLSFRYFMKACIILYASQAVKGMSGMIKLGLLMQEVNGKCQSQS